MISVNVLLRTFFFAAMAFGLAAHSSAAADLTAMEELGKALFFDVNLSINGNLSCAGCHGPEVGFTGPTEEINTHGAVYEGSIAGRFGNRKPPSAAYATFSPILHVSGEDFVGGNFWDGRATGEKLGNPAADQAQGPFLNPLEQALDTPADVVERVCAGSYGALFLEVAGETLCDPANVDAAYNAIALAIAAYEASPEVNAFTSKYDAVIGRHGPQGKVNLTALERRGRALFRGKAKCERCHPSKGRAPLFTDFTYDNLGGPRNAENPFYGEPDFNPLGADWVDLGLGGFLDTRQDYADLAEENYGKQKVPTLRNVDKRPYPMFVKAYGHNGYFKSLKGIVHFYNTRDVLPRCADPLTPMEEALAQNCWPEPEVTENVNADELGDLGLTNEEEDAIVAFLKTLSDGFDGNGP